MDTAWVSSAPALQVTVEPVGATMPGTCNRLSAPLGASGATATYTPAGPLDISAFDELRFWVNANQAAEGTSDAPFWLELSYHDVNDTVSEEHRWFVPINAADTWEQRRVGVESDRRSAIDRFRFTVLDDRSFSIDVDEFLAVQELMLTDVESALVDRIGTPAAIPSLVNVALTATSNPGSSTISVPAAAPFAVGNRILVTGGSAGDETHDVTLVTPGLPGSNLLHLTDTVVGTLTSGVAHATVVVPVIVEAPPTPTPAIVPAVVVTPLAAIEDHERTPYVDQRDSFRPRGALVACSVRSSARAYLIDYQVAVLAADRQQQVALTDEIQLRLSADVPLRVNGALWPVAIQPTLPLLNREFGTLAPSIYVRVSARSEIAARVETPWVQHVHVGAGRPDAPAETEAIEITL
ncbi:MAG: hypothetical protein ACRDL2_05085 [Gaiellaceae bacterium]